MKRNQWFAIGFFIVLILFFWLAEGSSQRGGVMEVRLYGCGFAEPIGVWYTTGPIEPLGPGLSFTTTDRLPIIVSGTVLIHRVK